MREGVRRMAKITAYHAPDGSISLRWPKDAIPDRETLEKVSKVITDIKKAPAQSGNSEQGSVHKDTSQDNNTTAE